MYQLPDPAIEAILKEWNPKEYDPPNTDVREWIHTIESLCDTYGIPDTQRRQCATRFIKKELRAKLENVLKDPRTRLGPVCWMQFANFMVALDHKFQEAWEELPFYRKHPKFTGAALFIACTALLAPVAIICAIIAVSFPIAGVAAAGLVAIISSIAGAAGVLFSLLRFVGATMALPSVGTIFAGVATRVARMRVPKIGESVIREILSGSIGRGPRPGGANAGDSNTGPPPYSQATLHEYLLTKQAIEAIVKSLDIPSFNPPGTDAVYWLSKLRDSCEVYGVPLTQRALCATHLMRTDCREAAEAAGCHNMTWDQFTTWLLRCDDVIRMNANRKMAELLAKRPKV